jgi:Ca2+-binding EF-hand superfamily protein
MIHHLAVKEDTEDIRQLFYYIDKNNDGKLQYDEFVEGFKVVNQKEKDKDMLKVLKFIDQTKVGFLEYEGIFAFIPLF